jgi:hypothetical protein
LFADRRKELHYFEFSHLGRMALIVEKDEAADLIAINLFGANAIMSKPDRITDQVHQFGIARVNPGGYCHLSPPL